MITLLQLDYFRKLAATEHITQTAKELYISQTALSSMIIGLEKELGIQLFDRSKRSIRLNEAGKLYLQYVNDVFTALDNGRSALQELTDSAEKQVSIAVGSSQVWLPMIRDFRKQYPECSIKQHNNTLEELIDALHSMTTDFVIASTDEIPDAGLEHIFLKKDSVYLCVPKSHRLAGRESVWLRELEDEAYIDLPAGTPWREYCSHLFQRAGVNIRTVLECDYSIRAALVDSEFGVALTSASAYEVDLLRPNCYIPIADEFACRDMALFWNPRKYMSRAAQSFRQFCVSYWEKNQV
ncbi:MAG: LysR family transcriptional regulator [Oscillospiraceae bacterium]|nr:LysR family transcriptional regulator [Oscillospiraceae bacterium]